jgi:hypothetical protein
MVVMRAVFIFSYVRLRPTCRTRCTRWHVFRMLLTSVRHEEWPREQKRNVHIVPFLHHGYEKYAFVIDHPCSVCVAVWKAVL